jgi:hypothetical protein
MTTRETIVSLLRDIRQLPELLWEAEYRSKYQGSISDRSIANSLLVRQHKEHHKIIKLSCLTLQEFYNEASRWMADNGVTADQVSLDHCHIPVPYEDYDEEGIMLGFCRIETDTEYLERLTELHKKWLVLVLVPVSSTEWSEVLLAINSKLYVARNITCNEDEIEKMLNSLDMIYNAINNDSNGEKNDVEMYRWQRLVYHRLRKEFVA